MYYTTTTTTITIEALKQYTTHGNIDRAILPAPSLPFPTSHSGHTAHTKRPWLYLNNENNVVVRGSFITITPYTADKPLC